MGMTFFPQARESNAVCEQKGHLGGAQCLWQYRIILSADTASEVRQLLSQKRR